MLRSLYRLRLPAVSHHHSRARCRLRSTPSSRFYAEILNGLRSAGTPIPTNDIWIAALAVEHGLRLVLMDRHFSSVARLILLSLKASVPKGNGEED